MAKNSDKKIVKQISEDSPGRDVVAPENAAQALDFIRSLSVEEQNEVIRMLVREGGINRLVDAVQANDTPGAFDLFLDRIEYWHFLKAVSESGQSDD